MLARRLNGFEMLFASNLLEAEFRAAARRERRVPDLAMLDALTWIMPARPLSPEIARVLSAGYVRGADCWHIANALFLDPDARELTFFTLDENQRAVAKALGFKT